jgi:hypothetical protein
MYKLLLSCLFLLSFNVHALELDAKRSSAESITVTVTGIDYEAMKECLDHGLTVRLRLEYKYCKNDKSIFPKCSAELVILRDFMSDPVAGGFKGSIDKLGDTGEPILWRTDTAAEGWESLTRDFEILTDRKNKNFVRIRAQSYCVGEASATLSELSTIFSLGIFRLGQESTGWVHFDITTAEESVPFADPSAAVE